ncbi:MAG: hypothetical protein QF464_00305, partial [Myxococcota bacterium]|nr:hypothetical protein [Myxococcota bacterium]
LEQGLASAFDWLIGLVMGTIENKIVETLEAQIPQQVVPLVNDLLGAFTSFERVFVLPAFRTGGNSATLNLSVALQNAVFAETGVHLSLEVGSSSQNELQVVVPGTLANASCEDTSTPPGEKLPKTSVVEAYLDVDLSNQLLYGLWSAGYTHTTVTDDTLGDMTESYGLSDPQITIEPMLPPVLTTCTDLGDAELQLGDVRVIAEFQTSLGPLTLDLFASATVGADLKVYPIPDAPDALGVEAVNPGIVVLDLQSVDGTLAFSDEVIELLLASVVSETLAGDLLSGLVGAFPLPAVPVGGYVPGLAPDTVMAFDPKTLEGGGAHLLIGGDLMTD